MKVGLATLDVVMKVSPELVNKVHSVVSLIRARVTREQHKGHIPGISKRCYKGHLRGNQFETSRG